MINTYQILINWDKGQAFAERMAAKILVVEGYEDIDPQCPVGGRDGTKDILCCRDDKSLVVGCYFPNGQKTETEINTKFSDDYAGVAKNNADGFVFVTNQKITPGERISLCKDRPNCTIYHGERVCGVLDSPKGYGIRLEYLGIELSKEEQLSYLNSHLDLKEQYEDLKQTLESLKKVTNEIAGAIRERDIILSSSLSTPPVAGLPISSRVSVEDIQAIHLACLYEAQEDALRLQTGLRKTDVWIGTAGCKPEEAEFTPPAPDQVPELLVELLDWWRRQYMDVLYSNRDGKIRAVAEFHVRFLSIHPFLDGNGRVARVLASIQLKDLIAECTELGPIEDIAAYYRALQNAREGDGRALVDVFMTLVR
jgi:hypothetical protein